MEGGLGDRVEGFISELVISTAQFGRNYLAEGAWGRDVGLVSFSANDEFVCISNGRFDVSEWALTPARAQHRRKFSRISPRPASRVMWAEINDPVPHPDTPQNLGQILVRCIFALERSNTHSLPLPQLGWWYWFRVVLTHTFSPTR